MMLPTPLDCMVHLSGGRYPNIEAKLLGFVPRTEPHTRTYDQTSRRDSTLVDTVDALVVLETFDKGRIYQIPVTSVYVGRYEDDTTHRS